MCPSSFRSPLSRLLFATITIDNVNNPNAGPPDDTNDTDNDNDNTSNNNNSNSNTDTPPTTTTQATTTTAQTTNPTAANELLVNTIVQARTTNNIVAIAKAISSANIADLPLPDDALPPAVNTYRMTTEEERNRMTIA